MSEENFPSDKSDQKWSNMTENWIFCLFDKKNVVNFLLKTFLKKHWYCFLSSCVNFISRKISAFQLWLEMFSTNKIAGFGAIYLITKQKKTLSGVLFLVKLQAIIFVLLLTSGGPLLLCTCYFMLFYQSASRKLCSISNCYFLSIEDQLESKGTLRWLW